MEMLVCLMKLIMKEMSVEGMCLVFKGKPRGGRNERMLADDNEE